EETGKGLLRLERQQLRRRKVRRGAGGFFEVRRLRPDGRRRVDAGGPDGDEGDMGQLDAVPVVGRAFPRHRRAQRLEELEHLAVRWAAVGRESEQEDVTV